MVRLIKDGFILDLARYAYSFMFTGQMPSTFTRYMRDRVEMVLMYYTKSSITWYSILYQVMLDILRKFVMCNSLGQVCPT